MKKHRRWRDFMKLLMIHGNLISNPEFKDGFNNWQIETNLEEETVYTG